MGTDRNLEISVSAITVKIGSRVYRLTETRQGRLEINKVDETDLNNAIEVYPKVTNVVEIK